MPDKRRRQKRSERHLAYAFGTVFVCTILALAIAIPHPTPFQYTVFRIVLSLAAAGVAAMIPGFVTVYISKFVRASGALAVFVIVYFFSPAELVVNPPSSDVSIVDINTTTDGFVRTEEDRTISIRPTFALQGVFDSTRNSSIKFPVVLDIKLLNKGDEVAFLKEIRLHISRGTLDPAPVIDYFPAVTQTGHNLLLGLRNYGWGPATISRFVPLLEDVTQYLDVDASTFSWSGTLMDNAHFVVPGSTIKLPREERVDADHLLRIESTLNPLRLRSTMSVGFGPSLDDEDDEARESYLETRKGVSYEKFFGFIDYSGGGGSAMSDEIRWGWFPGFSDLVFTVDGFHLQSLWTVRAYVPPSRNYDVELSINEGETTKFINVSHELKPDSADRLTLTVNAKESAVYQADIDLVLDDKTVTSAPIRLHVLAFKPARDDAVDVYVYESRQWRRVR